MRYIGSKKRLLPFIAEVIEKENVKGKVFTDAFGGTGSVGRWAKENGYSVISNDLLYFSYVLQFLNIQLEYYPNFEKLLFLKTQSSEERTIELLSYLNNETNNEIGFITKNYSPYNGNERKYFTESNAKKIDFVRTKIENWFKNLEISQDEYLFLIGTLLEAVPFISNISGVYGAYLKDWDKRAFKNLTLELPNIFNSNNHQMVYNKNANDLVKSIKTDILYLDPPYNARQYISNYHILETIALWDNPEITGVTGVRKDDNKKSDFCSKRKVLESFSDLIQKADAKLILLSYNTEGLMTEKEILEILNIKGDVTLYKQEYRRFQSDSNSENRKIEKNKVDEWLFACKVK